MASTILDTARGVSDLHLGSSSYNRSVRYHPYSHASKRESPLTALTTNNGGGFTADAPMLQEIGYQPASSASILSVERGQTTATTPIDNHHDDSSSDDDVPPPMQFSKFTRALLNGDNAALISSEDHIAGYEEGDNEAERHTSPARLRSTEKRRSGGDSNEFGTTNTRRLERAASQGLGTPSSGGYLRISRKSTSPSGVSPPRVVRLGSASQSSAGLKRTATVGHYGTHEHRYGLRSRETTPVEMRVKTPGALSSEQRVARARADSASKIHDQYLSDGEQAQLAASRQEPEQDAPPAADLKRSLGPSATDLSTSTSTSRYAPLSTSTSTFSRSRSGIAPGDAAAAGPNGVAAPLRVKRVPLGSGTFLRGAPARRGFRRRDSGEENPSPNDEVAPTSTALPARGQTPQSTTRTRSASRTRVDSNTEAVSRHDFALERGRRPGSVEPPGSISRKRSTSIEPRNGSVSRPSRSGSVRGTGTGTNTRQGSVEPPAMRGTTSSNQRRTSITSQTQQARPVLSRGTSQEPVPRPGSRDGAAGNSASGLELRKAPSRKPSVEALRRPLSAAAGNVTRSGHTTNSDSGAGAGAGKPRSVTTSTTSTTQQAPNDPIAPSTHSRPTKAHGHGTDYASDKENEIYPPPTFKRNAHADFKILGKPIAITSVTRSREGGDDSHLPNKAVAETPVPTAHSKHHTQTNDGTIEKRRLTPPRSALAPLESVRNNGVRSVQPTHTQPQLQASQQQPSEHRPAPPPKMSVLDTATSSMGASSTARSTKKKRAHVMVNGKIYSQLGRLGKGGSSDVYRVMAENGKMFGLKRVKLEEGDESAVRGYKGEIDLLQKLAGEDRVVRLFDWEIDESRGLLHVLMELGEVDLNKLLAVRLSGNATSSGTETHERSGFDLNFTRFYWREMLACVAAVHRNDIVHSDLKPANFLLVQGRLKLIDFGIANAIEIEHTINVHRESHVGTPNYMSPESIQDTNAAHPGGPRVVGAEQVGKLMKLGKPSDVWSLGCILYQMVYGRPPFAHIPNQLHRILAITNPNVAITFPDRGQGGAAVPASLRGTMKRCLQRDPRRRPSVVQLLDEHDAFCFPDGGGFTIAEQTEGAPLVPIGKHEALVPITEELLGHIIGKVVERCRDTKRGLPSEDEVKQYPANFFGKIRDMLEKA